MKTRGFDQRYLLQYPQIRRKIYAEKVWNIVSHVKNIAWALVLSAGIAFPTPASASGNTHLQWTPDITLNPFSYLKDKETEKLQMCGEGDMLFWLLPDPNFFHPEVCNPLQKWPIILSPDKKET